jgi:hypothetical protein
MTTPALQGALRAARDKLNARFAMARRRMPALDGEAFGGFLIEAVGPLAEAVAAAQSDRVGDVVHAAYDVALELCGQRLAGAGARDPRIGAAWGAVVRGAAQVIVEEPARALAASANAIASLAATPGARPDAWAASMVRVADGAPRVDAATWLAAGKVLAWRAGMAHYRAGALETADLLSPALALALVGAAPGDSWPAIRARLQNDPWFVPGAAEAAAAREARVVARVGGFRGFGGLFTAPPTVAAGAVDRFLVGSGGERWVLFADACGATFHRASDADRPRTATSAATAAEAVAVRGRKLQHGGAAVDLPVRGAITSHATTARTVAVTSAQTHAIVLVALPVSK